MLRPSNYVDRDAMIVELCRGKRILHLGCIGFTIESEESRINNAKMSLHQKLTESAQVIGIDYSEEIINFFKRHGIFNNVLYGDVEKLRELGFSTGQFDLIVIGDIIEHLSNPGLMLEQINTIADNETVLIVTTPNSAGLPNLIRYALNKNYEGPDHVLSFSVFTLRNLLLRYKFELIDYNTCFQVASQKKIKPFFFNLAARLFQANPKWGGTLICQFRKHGKNIKE